MADLTPSQIRLLRELDFYGGVLIIRTHADNADYAVLEKDGLVTAFALNISKSNIRRASSIVRLAGPCRLNHVATKLLAKHLCVFLQRKAEDVVANVIAPKVVAASAE